MFLHSKMHSKLIKPKLRKGVEAIKGTIWDQTLKLITSNFLNRETLKWLWPQDFQRRQIWADLTSELIFWYFCHLYLSLSLSFSLVLSLSFFVSLFFCFSFTFFCLSRLDTTCLGWPIFSNFHLKVKKLPSQVQSSNIVVF